MRKTTLRLALALCLLPAIAWAAQRYVDIEQRLTPEQVREVGLTPTQLALLNRMLREASEQDAGSLDEPIAQKRTPAYIGLDDKPIKSRMVGSISAWEPGTVFVLANGQQWKVLKGPLRRAAQFQALAPPRTDDCAALPLLPGHGADAGTRREAH